MMWKNTGRQRPPCALEPAAGQESVWDYPRPPGLVASSSLLVVRHGNTELARTNRSWRLLETASPPGYYIPPVHIVWGELQRIDLETWCEWKGKASYWCLARDPDQVAVAWAYAQPRSVYSGLSDYVSFYPGRVECSVDGERVRAQPGQFYGGWVTDSICGPVKGEAGTEHW